MKKIMFNDRYGLTDAVLQGRKTMTRRVVPDKYIANSNRAYKAGEVVAVAQSYNGLTGVDCPAHRFPHQGAGWFNKMFVRAELMPNRILITDVRVERLQDISDEDCLREGVFMSAKGFTFIGAPKCYETAKDAFAHLINKVSKKGTWESNPFVFCYTLKLLK